MTPEEREQLSALADQRRAEVDAEYGQFVAAQDITFNGALAYPLGAPVPVSNVREHGYLTHGLVETVEQAQARRDAAAKAAADAEADRQARIAAEWESATSPQPVSLSLDDDATEQTDGPAEVPDADSK